MIDPVDLQPLIGVYGQMGYQVLVLSAETGFGVERLRRLVANQQSVVAGQSGVGKSSLLNAIQPDLHLRVRTVSDETQKGRHTTTTAQLIPLECGGYVVDTPGIRQFQLWDVSPEEVAAYFRDLRPFVSRCRFPDCTHTHEDGSQSKMPPPTAAWMSGATKAIVNWRWKNNDAHLDSPRTAPGHPAR